MLRKTVIGLAAAASLALAPVARADHESPALGHVIVGMLVGAALIGALDGDNHETVN